ncbi:MAG TPA: sigma-70 family RNA polymerase sigma factor [Gemmatimonadaceae bacterium]|nr:sigma-70 family RNA polymerase sigma factor [Gemmatimonadaceae bacterium]
MTQPLAPTPAIALVRDETSLVDRARAGEPAAQRALYDAHVDRVYRVAYRLAGREELAREFTQDAFVRAFQRLDDFRGDAAFGTWMHTIVTSVTLNGLRRHKRNQDREAPLEEAVTIARPGGDDFDLRERLARAVAALPEGCRTVFLLHDAEGYTHEEIAATLGVTAGTTKTQLSRARAKLRVALAAFAKEWTR